MALAGTNGEPSTLSNAQFEQRGKKRQPLLQLEAIQMANYNPRTWTKDRMNDALWGEGAEHNALFKALSSYIGSDEFPPTYIYHDYFFLGLEIAEYDARIDSYDGEEYFVRIACYFLECINRHVSDDYGEGHEHQRWWAE